MVVKTKPVGLYELIGGAKNGETNLKVIEDFLARNILEPEIQERLSAWKSEFEFWEKNAVIYPYMELGFHYRSLVKTMREFAEPKAGQVWLDAGCGPAKMSELLWEKSGKSLKKIVGLDIILEPARKRAEEISVLELKYGNLGERLEFDDGTFDGIISNIAIPYVIEFEGCRGKEGMQSIFKELARVLKPGGQLVWSAPKRNMHTEICLLVSIPDVIWNIAKIPNLPVIALKLLKYGKELERKGKEGIYTYLAPQEWDEILEEAGFVSPAWRFVFTHQVWVNKTLLGP